METANLFEKYVVDTNVILNFWILNDDEPMGKDVHASAWNFLESQIESGAIVAPLDVKHELIKHGTPELITWMHEHEKMFISVSEEILVYLTAISQMHPIYKTTKGSATDAIIVAMAKVRGLGVITSEKHESMGNRSKRNPKIPNVCEDMDVRWYSVNGFFRAEGQSF